MPEKSYYDVLGVSRTATAAEIKTAYLSLAKKNHPDLKNPEDTSIEKYHLRFIEINRAYSTLSHDDRRRKYDEMQAAGQSAEGLKQSKTTTTFFKQGVRSFNQGNMDEAIAAFENALRSETANHKARAYLGIACFKKGDFRKAEMALKAATLADPKNAEYFYYLGLTYKRMGDKPKALDAFQEAVAQDQEFELAVEELERLLTPEKKSGSFLGSLSPSRIFSKVFKQG